jgi:hypothetical protein
MKKIITWFAMSAMVAMFLAPVALWAEDEEESKETITGKVEVTKEKGEVKKITLTKSEKDEDGETETVVYVVKLDKKGLALAKLEGKSVTVVGTVQEVEDGDNFVLTLTVQKLK